MQTLVDVAWIAQHDPAPAEVHRVGLTTGRLVCADWVTAAAGERLPLAEARDLAPLCPYCWPGTTATTEGERR